MKKTKNSQVKTIIAKEFESQGELRDVIVETMIEARQDLLKLQDTCRKVFSHLKDLSRKESENFKVSVLDVINDPDYSLLIYMNELIDKLGEADLSYDEIEE